MVTNLPIDAITHAFSYLSTREFYQCAEVCRTFQQVANNDDLFKFLRELKEKERVTSDDIAACFKLFQAKKIVDLNDLCHYGYDCFSSKIKAEKILFSNCSAKLKHIECDGNPLIGNIGHIFHSVFNTLPSFKFCESLVSLRLQAIENRTIILDQITVAHLAYQFPQVKRVELLIICDTFYYSAYSEFVSPRNFGEDLKNHRFIATLDLERYRQRLRPSTYIQRFKNFLNYFRSYFE